MEKAGILWTTGILHGDVISAISFHTGGAWVPYMSSQWSQLDHRIKSSPYSSWEFAFWVIHYVNGPGRLDNLQKLNFLTKDGTWHDFLEWKTDCDRYARVQMDIHMDEAKTSARMRDMEDVLMDDMLEIGPVARVEAALHLEAPGKVVEKYSSSAGDVLRGMPEFINHSPKLNAYLEMPNAARQFLPR